MSEGGAATDKCSYRRTEEAEEQPQNKQQKFRIPSTSRRIGKKTSSSDEDVHSHGRPLSVNAGSELCSNRFVAMEVAGGGRAANAGKINMYGTMFSVGDS